MDRDFRSPSPNVNVEGTERCVVADFSRKCSIGIHTDSGRLDRSQTCFDEEHVRQQRDRNGRWALFGTRQT